MGTSSSKYESVATVPSSGAALAAAGAPSSTSVPSAADDAATMGVVVRHGLQYRRTVLLVYDTFELPWDCCNIYRRCTDPDWHHHEIFLREKSALRQIGRELRRRLGATYDFAELTLEEDLRSGNKIPMYDVAVLLQHDWPTVNENPEWLLKFTNFLQMSPVVPAYSQTFDLFNKTTYLRKILDANRACRGGGSDDGDGGGGGGGGSRREAEGGDGDEWGPPGPEEVPLLPTIIVDPGMDMRAVVARILRGFRGEQVVLKENFSAGKEGVTMLQLNRAGDPRGEQLERDLEAHRFIMQSRANANQVISPSFVVQEFEPEFATAAEIRVFYVEGQFAYAVEHVGWIGPGSWPMPQRDPAVLGPLQATVRLIMRALPSLRNLYMTRFDFGPRGRLNEIEIFPDLFGGPACSLATQEWEEFRDHLTGALARAVVRRLSGVV